MVSSNTKKVCIVGNGQSLLHRMMSAIISGNINNLAIVDAKGELIYKGKIKVHEETKTDGYLDTAKVIGSGKAILKEVMLGYFSKGLGNINVINTETDGMDLESEIVEYEATPILQRAKHKKGKVNKNWQKKHYWEK